MVCFAPAYDLHTAATFHAFVDAVIPAEPALVQAPGAVNLQIHTFLIWDLDRSQAIPPPGNLPLSKSTAYLLDAGAVRLIQSGQAAQPLPNGMLFSGEGTFASLPRYNRLQAITLLDRLQIDLRLLPPPYQNNPGLIQVMMNSINQLTLFGYYSEWYGYGTTRYCAPDYRQLECVPPSWSMTGYPGPSFGYRDLRGFIFDYPCGRGEKC